MSIVSSVLKKYQSTFHPVIHSLESQASIDMSMNNKALNENIFSDIDSFSNFLQQAKEVSNVSFLSGGYNELRNIYSKSELFSGEEPRRLHLGTDIWGEAGTPVYAFLGGMVHSFAFNDNDGDYGATLVLLHQLDGIPFYTLYGHISLHDIDSISAGQYVTRGQEIAHFGEPKENGHWPPHLHFQIISEMGLHKGDFPGVCKLSEKEIYLANCPDPNLVLQLK